MNVLRPDLKNAKHILGAGLAPVSIPHTPYRRTQSKEETMKRLLLPTILILALIAGGCGAAASPESGFAPAPAATMAPSAAEAPPKEDSAGNVQNQTATDDIQEGRKVIYNANMALVVNDTEATAKQIDDLAQSLGGYVANMNAYRGYNDILVYDISLRIPADRFEAARTALRAMAVRVDNDNINTDDVTDQYFDIEARLNSLRATETELLKLLAETRERGGKVEDIMSIYRELTTIQGEIESLQGQLNRLDKLIALSTITINVRPDELATPIVEDSWRPLETLRNSAGALVNVLRNLVDLVIYLVVVVLPVLVLLAIPVLLVLFFLRWIIRRRQERKKTAA